MHVNRLRIVNDICPVPGNGSLCPSGTRWQGNVAPSIAPVLWRDDGYTATVVRNPLITWFRTFTSGNVAPDRLPTSKSLLTLHEWIPTSMPTNRTGWKHVSAPDLAAVSMLSENYLANWSEQARRHLRTFTRSGLTLAIGSLADVDAVNAHSQVPKYMRVVFRDALLRHLTAQPETVDFLTARTPDGQPVAVFVAGNCDEIRQSTYLIGGFDSRFAKSQAMAGLVDWWFRRSIERGYATVNFGDIVPSRPLPEILERGIGYSLFKTHFGINRVNLPGSFWKVAR